jgi:hypothetical protein
VDAFQQSEYTYLKNTCVCSQVHCA